MANKFKFTKTEIQRLDPPAPGKRITAYDTVIPKLAVRVTAAGTKTFYVIRRTGSEMAWVKLGVFGDDLTVEKARTEAQKVLGEFAGGANPAAARRAVRQEPTFLEVFNEYLNNKRKRDGTSLSDKTKRDYRDLVRLYMSKIASKRLSEVTRDSVKAVHRAATMKSAAQADKCTAVVGAVFTYALDREIFSGMNPASRVQKNPAPSRERFAVADELPYLFAAIERSSQRDFFLLAMLTGARRGNLQSMAWRDLDLEGAVWRIPMTKNGTPQNVVLVPEAVAILRARKDRADEARGLATYGGISTPYVFSGKGITGHLQEPKTAWAQVRRDASLLRLLDAMQGAGVIDEEQRRMADDVLIKTPNVAERTYHAMATAAMMNPGDYSIKDLRIHDLRRTLGSWQAKSGASLQIIGKSLNHKTHQATLIYARLDMDPVRQSVSAATAAMLKAAGLEERAPIISIKETA